MKNRNIKELSDELLIRDIKNDIRNFVTVWIDRKSYLEALDNLLSHEVFSDAWRDIRRHLAIELVCNLIEDIGQYEIASKFRGVME